MKRGALLLAALLLAGCGAAKEEPGPAPFTVVKEAHAAATTRAQPAGRYLTARVIRVTRLRATPGGRKLMWIGTRTEFDSPRVLSVTARRGGWLRVLASSVPCCCRLATPSNLHASPPK